MTPTKKKRGTWCEACQETHPLSRSKYAAPGQCQSCDVLTTDIRLIPIVYVREGKDAINLVLLCTPCVRNGVKVTVEKDGGVTVEKRLVSSGTH